MEVQRQEAEEPSQPPPTLRAEVKTVDAAELLPVTASADDNAYGEGVDCPRCAACVLDSDMCCNQCGLRRRTQAEDDDLEARRATAKAIQEVGTHDGPSGALSQSGHGKDGESHNAMDLWSGGRWHGGTLAPPPFMMGSGSLSVGSADAAAALEPSRKPRLVEKKGPAKDGKRKAELDHGPPPKRQVSATLLPALEAMRERIRQKMMVPNG